VSRRFGWGISDIRKREGEKRKSKIENRKEGQDAVIVPRSLHCATAKGAVAPVGMTALREEGPKTQVKKPLPGAPARKRNSKIEKRKLGRGTRRGDLALIPPLRNGKRRRCSGRDDRIERGATQDPGKKTVTWGTRAVATVGMTALREEQSEPQVEKR
jgi:hypothetical protein